MVDFVNKIELSDQIYQNNGIVRYENYKGRCIFPMRDLVPLGSDSQSMYFYLNQINKIQY